ncbi:putative methyltransferase C9orf114 homolog [Rhipicephalus sanguineus]|uniref:putative methyltransferase C9orf114 homolog n=1 Tax=Rhipicephalus sanguineus TaxID=34632 RepID=UPI001895047B|nr:putative methyltransferase C9orf114 homolog [Rhipicephalus sanguineus]
MKRQSSGNRTHANEDEPCNWKKWRAERKQQLLKWREERLIKKLEKEKKAKESEEQQASSMDSESKGRKYTLSIAVPGSIMDNAQNAELRTYLAGQIARAAVVFCVDEIVVYDDDGSTTRGANGTAVDGEFGGLAKSGQGVVQLARVLQYLECPQYLRKHLFPLHRDLQFAGLLNPLDCPHHLRATEESPYREGIVARLPVKEGSGSYVNCGLNKEVKIDRCLQPGVRVTVKMKEGVPGKKLRGTAVSPSCPRTEAGLYWGYEVRVARSLGAVLAECPFPGGYDITLGTSERGTPVDELELPHRFEHALVVFGGLKGLEAALEADEALDVDDPEYLFNHYLNTCPSQGSRTIRTEEAILISLSALRPKIVAAQSGDSAVDSS